MRSTVCRVQQKSHSKDKTGVNVCIQEKDRKITDPIPFLRKREKTNLININQSKRNQNCIRN